MSEWQPIDTAPKDGTEIDIWQFCHDPKWRPDSHGIELGTRITDVKWEDVVPGDISTASTGVGVP